MASIKRALLSVSDKTGLAEFGAALRRLDIEILSTGGTAATLRDAGVDVIDVASVTGFPEIMGGRVKTLHPKIHGGILARRGVDEAVLSEHSIEAIDLVVINLYPFGRTVSKADVDLAEAIENIDIGGPAMIRAAAKNHQDVLIVTDPADYTDVAAALEQPDPGLNRRLALKAFSHTAAYDAAIADYLSTTTESEGLPCDFTLGGQRARELRYGENPHQGAAFYKDSGHQVGTIAAAELIQGKPLSYNNLADGDAALECVRQFDEPACVIVKHANPCGVACAATLSAAYDAAFKTDPTSAFGGIIAFNQAPDAALVSDILERQFVEVLIAPAIDDATRQALLAKKNVRVLVTGPLGTRTDKPVDIKKVSGGFLVQSRDDLVLGRDAMKVVSKRAPTDAEWRDLAFAWQVVKYVKSNAIVFCKKQQTIGVGAGQMSRVYSTRIAAIKAADENLDVAGSVMASDAFFPFRDGIDSAAPHGITAVIQPGGSIRDEEVIAAADEHDLAMVFTNVRHFRH